MPFWIEHAEFEICPVFTCAAKKKKIEHCGNCDSYPCKMYLDLRDPSMNDEEWNKSLSERKENLMRRKNI